MIKISSIVSGIIYVNFSEDDRSWLQATLPVAIGSLRICSAAAVTNDLGQEILSPHFHSHLVLIKDDALSAWSMATSHHWALGSSSPDNKAQARLLGVSMEESGAWLIPSPSEHPRV